MWCWSVKCEVMDRCVDVVMIMFLQQDNAWLLYVYWTKCWQWDLITMPPTMPRALRLVLLRDGPYCNRMKSSSPNTRGKVDCPLVFPTFCIYEVECATAGAEQIRLFERGSSAGFPSRKICRINAAGSDVELPQREAT